jgi:hypothetical protein
MIDRRLAFVVATGAIGVIPAARVNASITAGGVVDVHGGYGSNPFFSQNSPGASPLVGATVTVKVVRQTGVSRTELSGTADLSQYVKHYSLAEDYVARLSHNQQITEKLAVMGSLAYENSVNPLPSYSTRSSDLAPLNDLLTVGQRQYRYSAGLNVTYEPNTRNLYQFGVNGTHSGFTGGVGSSYNQYGGTLGYLRTISERTRIGIQGGYSAVQSKRYPSSQSFNIGLQLMQKVGSYWEFNGGASFLLQRQGGLSFKNIGFNGSLCGKYPRFTVCVLGSRQSAASGLGGQRTDTQGGARANYKLTEHSTIEISSTYDLSQATGSSVPAQKYFDAAASYRRELTPRLSVGASGRYQNRDYGSLFGVGNEKANAYTGTLNVIWKFGRASI